MDPETTIAQLNRHYDGITYGGFVGDLMEAIAGWLYAGGFHPTTRLTHAAERAMQRRGYGWVVSTLRAGAQS